MPTQEECPGQPGTLASPRTVDPGMTQDGDPTIDGYSENSLLPDQPASTGLFGGKNMLVNRNLCIQNVFTGKFLEIHYVTMQF